MSEAIISRASFSDGGISDETKASVGLTSDATLDDVLQVLALRSDEYGTIVATLKDPKGNPVVGEKIQMIDASDNILNYTTDEKGQCIFKTNSGQATIIDYEKYNMNWFDIETNNIVVDATIGTVKSAQLQRKYKYNENSNVKLISNTILRFSPYLNNVYVKISGQGGSSGCPYSLGNIIFNLGAAAHPDYGVYSTFEIDNPWKQNNFVTGGYGGNGYTNETLFNISPNQNYHLTIYNSFKNNNITTSISGSNKSDSSIVQNYNAVFSYSYMPGETGGSTTFYNISALGGSGGIQNNNIRQSGGNGSKGGNNGRMYARYYLRDSLSLMNAIATQQKGIDGYGEFSNFQYK